MSAWEVTESDVMLVLHRHDLPTEFEDCEACYELLSQDDILDAVLDYTDFNDQVAMMLSMIEDQLMEEGVIPNKQKKYPPPE